MQFNLEEEKVDLNPASSTAPLDLLGSDVTQEALANYIQSNYTQSINTGAQASLMSLLLLATL